MRCPQCGSNNQEPNKFCTTCGIELVANLIQTEQPYKQIVNLAVPRSTSWQPQQAQQLVINLFALPVPVKLGIRALANNISWSIEIRTKYTEALVKTIYALYPQAHIVVTPKNNNHINYYLFDLHTTAPFVAPLKVAEDFSRLDPLTTLVNVLTDLLADEAIVYELSLADVESNYYEIGEKLITASTVNWWNFLHPGVAVAAAATKLAGADKVDKYAPEIQKPARAKLNSTLKKVFFEIKIKAQTDERANDLIQAIFPTLAVFEREGLNFLTAPHDKSFAPILAAGEVAALWHLPTEQLQTSGIVWSPSAVAPIPNQLISQDQGVVLGTNVYQGRVHSVRLPYEDRVTHVNLVGRTRVGKSTMLHHMIHQDIAEGKGVAVIDPHGDLIEAIMYTSVPKNREQEVVLFDTRDQAYPIGLNLLATLPGLSDETTASYALTVMRKIFADQWSSGRRMETVLDAALRALVMAPGTTIRDVPRFLLDPQYRRHILKHVTNSSTLDFWFEEYDLETPSQQKEFARPINHRIRKFYSHPVIERIVCQQSSLDFRQILDEGRIFLANLSGVSEVEADTLGTLLISKIQMAAMSRGDVSQEERTAYYLYVDEVQSFIATSLSQVFSEAGKYGLSLTVANQYLKQLEGDTLESLMGNVGTTIIFRIGPQDARALAPFVKPQISPEDLTNLDRFTTVAKMQLGGETLPAFSMTTHKPLKKSEDGKKRLECIRQYSQQTYGRPQKEVDVELRSRYTQRKVEEGNEPEGSYFD